MDPIYKQQSTLLTTIQAATILAAGTKNQETLNAAKIMTAQLAETIDESLGKMSPAPTVAKQKLLNKFQKEY